MIASIRFLVWGPIPVVALPVVVSPLLTMGGLPRELDVLADEV